MDSGCGGSFPDPLTSDPVTQRARELQDTGRGFVTHKGLAHPQYGAQASYDYVLIRLAMIPFPGGMQVGRKKESWKGWKIGEKLGRNPFLLGGRESVPMRRGKRFTVCCTFNACLSFVNKTSEIRPAVSWDS